MVHKAKKSGMWDFMSDVDALIVPDDLQSALEEKPPALENFHSFPASAKRDIIRWIKLAKKSETRQKRIARSNG